MQKVSVDVRSKRQARKATVAMAYIAIAVALNVVCAYLTVPSVIPFTMQTFAVFFSLCFLGGACGTAVIVVYLLMGVIGLPVFSGFNGGISAIMGPTGGYLLGFLASALLYWSGTAIWRKKADTVWLRSVLCVFGLLACYLLGTGWFIYVYHATDSWAKALTMCVVPYLIPDALKITLAVSLAVAVRKALPASAFFAEKAKNKE